MDRSTRPKAVWGFKLHRTSRCCLSGCSAAHAQYPGLRAHSPWWLVLLVLLTQVFCREQRTRTYSVRRDMYRYRQGCYWRARYWCVSPWSAAQTVGSAMDPWWQIPPLKESRKSWFPHFIPSVFKQLRWIYHEYPLDVTLKEDSQSLKEVVVTALAWSVSRTHSCWVTELKVKDLTQVRHQPNQCFAG